MATNDPQPTIKVYRLTGKAADDLVLEHAVEIGELRRLARDQGAKSLEGCTTDRSGRLVSALDME